MTTIVLAVRAIITKRATFFLYAQELNYCAKIEENTNYMGNDIRYENRSNHWFPATISTCCASCRNSKSDPGSPAACVCWVWGYNNNKDCQENNFKEDEGCCWLKRADDNGGACEAGRIESSSQISGRFIEGEPHEGGLPDRASSGWTVVTIVMGFVFVSTAYSRVSPSFGQNLKSLVADGVTFTIGVARGRGDYTPIEKDPFLTEKAGSHAKASGSKGALQKPSAMRGGRATALHEAAAIGKTSMSVLANHGCSLYEYLAYGIQWCRHPASQALHLTICCLCNWTNVACRQCSACGSSAEKQQLSRP